MQVDLPAQPATVAQPAAASHAALKALLCRAKLECNVCHAKTGRLRAPTARVQVSGHDNYRGFLVCLLSTHFWDLLGFLSVRCVHPTQQHGRRFPPPSSSIARLICSFLVSTFLTDVVQQIHSLRASGLISSHATSAFLDAARAFLKSSGSLCAVPPGIALSVIAPFYPVR